MHPSRTFVASDRKAVVVLGAADAAYGIGVAVAVVGVGC